MAENYKSLSYCKGISFTTFDNVPSESESNDFFSDLGGKKDNLNRVMRGDNSYTWTDYGQDVLKIMYPWIACIGTALIIFILALLYRCIKKMCCKNKLKGSNKFIRRTCILGTVIFTALAIACVSILIWYTDYVYQGIQQVRCASGRIPNEILYGSESENWVGLDQGIKDTDEVIEQLNYNYPTATLDTWANSDWMNDAEDNIDVLINAYYDKYNGMEVINPNPLAAEGSTVLTNYTNHLGPTDDDETFSGIIMYEANAKLIQVIEVMIEIKNTTLNSLSEMQQVTSELEESKTSLVQFKNGTEEVNDHIKDWILDNNEWIKGSWNVLYSSEMGIGYIILSSTILTLSIVLLGLYRHAKCLHCYWIFFGLLGVIGFIGTTLIVGASVGLHDSCRFAKDAITTEGLHEYTVLFPEDTADYLNVCFNEDGDLAKYLNLTDELSYAYTILNISSEFQHYDINKTYLTTFESITINEKAATYYRTNYLDTVDPSVDDADQPSTIFAILNSWSDYYFENSLQKNEGKCTVFSVDEWVFEKSLCDDTYTYINSSDPSNNVGKATCLVITEWSSENITSRYSGYLDCSAVTPFNTVENTIIQYQSQFVAYMESVDDLFTQISADLETLNTALVGYGDQTATQAAKAEDYFNVDLADLMNALFGQGTGLLLELNCAFIRSIYDDLNTSVCKNVVPSMLYLFTFGTILSISAMLLMFTNLYLARRLRKPNLLRF